MVVVVLGCGRVGARVAANLAQRYDVVVVDWNRKSLSRLPDDFGGETVVGNVIDTDVLRTAGAHDADLVLAVTDSDNCNLMASQVARELGARRVVARVYDPIRAEIFRNLGIATICPTVHAAHALFDLVTSE